MRNICFLVIAIAFLCLSQHAHANTFLRPLGQSSNSVEISPESGASFIHYGEVSLIDAKNKGDIANIGVLIGQRAIAIVDSGGSAYVARELLKEIRKISDLAITHIIITHAHPDHWMGLPVLLAETDARLVVHHAFVDMLTQRIADDVASLTEALEEEDDSGSAYQEFSIQQYSNRVDAVETEAIVSLGGRNLKIQALPTSHTNNDLVIWDTQKQTLWAGDLFFVEHVPTFEASLKGLQKSRAIMEGYAASLIVSGHGQPEPDWRLKWDQQWQYFDGLTQQVRQQVSQGVSLQAAVSEAEEKAKSSDHSTESPTLGNWRLMDPFHPRNVTRAYQELEWE